MKCSIFLVSFFLSSLFYLLNYAFDVVYKRIHLPCLIIEQLASTKELDFDFSLEDLETIKVIGKGSGGVVQLVRHKWLGKLFALKVSIPVKFLLFFISFLIS